MKLCLLLLIFCLGCAGPAFAAPNEATLGAAIRARLVRTPEFGFIADEASKLGVKVFLFGGTAASYAHYVRQDLLRESGDAQLAAQKFDYDYTNIFRSTQDLDVVIDGSAAQAEQLEKVLKRNFPHFLGDKANKWEVRPLREARGEKDAILGNPHFEFQHTDSHSTGMIALNAAAGEPVVRDVRDWNHEGAPQFLRDVTEQKLHYYWSPKHETTKRFLEGKNPPIVSAIRYLTKAFQYDLAIQPEDRQKIQAVVEAFDPAKLDNDYVKDWIEKNGKKLFQHSVDLERSWKELESLGLRQKLIQLSGKPEQQDSLAWWMERQPLLSHPVGAGDGKTAAEVAAELGEKELQVSHETRGFTAYESLTRDRGAKLNAFVSRENKVGETALHGEGFYTKIGRSGAVGTGYTIRLRVKPDAREGSDFTRIDDFILVKNKAAVEVIPEELNLSLLQFFQQLADTGKAWNPDDRALLEAFRRKAGRAGIASPEDLAAIKRLVEAEFARKEPEKPRLPILAEWMNLPESAKDTQLAERAVRTLLDGKLSPTLVGEMLGLPHWVGRPELLESLARADDYRGNSAIVLALTETHWREHPTARAVVKKWIDDAKDRGGLLSPILMSDYWMAHPEQRADLWQELLRSHHTLDRASEALTHPRGRPLARLEATARELLATGRADEGFSRFLTFGEEWKNHPLYGDVVDALVQHGKQDKYLAEYALAKDEATRDPRWSTWFRTVLDRGEQDPVFVPRLGLLKEPALTQTVETLLARGRADVALARAIGGPELVNHPRATQWLKRLTANNQDALKTVLVYTLAAYDADPKIPWPENPDAADIVRRAVKNGGADGELAMLFREPDWMKHPEAPRWMRTIIERNEPDALNILAQHSVLKNREWERYHPDFAAELAHYGADPEKLHDAWTRPAVRRGPGGAVLTVDCSIGFAGFRKW